jgi:tetratricopeptide (TPR) repeat protein
MDKIPEAVTQLVGFLEVSPVDAEAWAELSELYLSQGQFDQAIFCLEEVLIIAPNAWNVRRPNFLRDVVLTFIPDPCKIG